eukprot:TRINITY_DN4293_c0_g1_i1.p1 TRINITY_DN4293_c0_g1~~TRINITY_DN4293_c0_g1_i1.p1  ORF type:complete len:449 (+),score=120.34 TRINITY_DN4293_c0_g1_i1:119-1465(+)
MGGCCSTKNKVDPGSQVIIGAPTDSKKFLNVVQHDKAKAKTQQKRKVTYDSSIDELRFQIASNKVSIHNLKTLPPSPKIELEHEKLIQEHLRKTKREEKELKRNAKEPQGYSRVHLCEPETIASKVVQSKNIAIVVGYGVLASRTQFEVCEIVELLKSIPNRDVKCYIHYRAGRKVGLLKRSLRKAGMLKEDILDGKDFQKITLNNDNCDFETYGLETMIGSINKPTNIFAKKQINVRHNNARSREGSPCNKDAPTTVTITPASPKTTSFRLRDLSNGLESGKENDNDSSRPNTPDLIIAFGANDILNPTLSKYYFSKAEQDEFRYGDKDENKDKNASSEGGRLKEEIIARSQRLNVPGCPIDPDQDTIFKVWNLEIPVLMFKRTATGAGFHNAENPLMQASRTRVINGNLKYTLPKLINALMPLIENYESDDDSDYEWAKGQNLGYQ